MAYQVFNSGMQNQIHLWQRNQYILRKLLCFASKNQKLLVKNCLISHPFFGNLITHITISEKQVYFPREGCEDSDNISICEIGNDKLIIPAHFQNDTKHQHLGLYLKDSSNAIVGAFMKKTAKKFLESLNDKTDGCWELSSDGEGMKIIQVYQKC